MEFQARQENGVAVVALSGRLDTVTAPDYEQQIQELIEGGATRVVLDLASLEYVSSAGLRSLLVTGKMLAARHGQLRFANVSGNVLEVFQISRFSTMFQLEDSVAAALDSLA